MRPYLRAWLIVAAGLILTVSPLDAAPMVPNYKFVSRDELVSNGKPYDGQIIMSLGKLETKNMFVHDNVSHYKDVAYLADPNDAQALFHFDSGVCVETAESTYSGILARLTGMTIGVSGTYHRPAPEFPPQCHNGTIEVRMVFVKTED